MHYNSTKAISAQTRGLFAYPVPAELGSFASMELLISEGMVFCRNLLVREFGGFECDAKDLYACSNM
eukprot:6057661-Amphidinium_carterae.1